MSKEKRQEAGRPVGGGLNMDGIVLRKGVFGIGRNECAGITDSILSKLSLMGE